MVEVQLIPGSANNAPPFVAIPYLDFNDRRDQALVREFRRL
jgi:hypothetical protein